MLRGFAFEASLRVTEPVRASTPSPFISKPLLSGGLFARRSLSFLTLRAWRPVGIFMEFSSFVVRLGVLCARRGAGSKLATSHLKVRAGWRRYFGLGAEIFTSPEGYMI